MEKVYVKEDNTGFEPIDLMEMLYALRKRVKLLIAAAILGGLLAGAYTCFLVTPLYNSTAVLLVLSKDTTLTSLADLQLGAQLAKDYSVLVTSRPVLKEVIANVDLDIDWAALKANVSVTNPSDTRLLELTVTNPDPDLAKKIVDELAEVASGYVGEQMEVIPPKIIEDGIRPVLAVSPNMPRNVMKGALAGFALVAVLVAVLALMDDSIRSEEDIEKYLDIPMLANIPDRKDYISGSPMKKKRRKPKWQNRTSS